MDRRKIGKARPELAVVPGNDAGIGRPVGLVSDLAGWRAPQYLPGSPHRLPGQVRRPGAPLIGGMGGPQASSLPPAVPTTPVSDAWHKASMTSVLVNVGAIGSAASLVPFLTMGGTPRNLLTLRNLIGAAGVLYIDFNQPATANSPLVLAAGQTFLFDMGVPQDDLYVAGSVAGLAMPFAYSTLAP